MILFKGCGMMHLVPKPENGIFNRGVIYPQKKRGYFNIAEQICVFIAEKINILQVKFL